MYNTSFVKKLFLAVIAVFLYSCDKDFNALGDGLVGDDHFGLEPEDYSVIAFNQEVTPIQSNNLPTNALGIYDDPVFGSTTANFVTQVGLESYAPTIGETPVIESVTLHIPYFIKSKTTNDEGNSTYELDSIYGNEKSGKLKLSIYESKMQMRNSYFSNGSQLPQFYYTDQATDFFNTIGADAKRLNNGGVLENDEFFFSSAEYVVKTTDPDTKVETVDRTAPEMRLSLDKTFFQDKILNAAASKLSSEDIFQEYFRGLYFKVEKSGSSPSNMALIDFTGGTIEIKYKAKTASTTDDKDATEEKTLKLLLKSGLPSVVASTANFLQTAKEPNYQTALTNANNTVGDDRLYLKGGQGSVAVIKLFNQVDVISYNDEGEILNKANGVPDELDKIRNSVTFDHWKVNEANLVFYLDADKMGSNKVPQRVYLYDLTNNVALLDYSTDGTVLGGLLTVDSKKGNYYKLRITSHIRNLIKDETAKNVDLGLVISQSLPTTLLNVLKNKIQINTEPAEYFSAAPRPSVMSPLGVILYGGTESAEAKKVKLQVYYTKPN